MLTASHYAILDRLYSCPDHKCRRKIFTESFSKDDFLNFHYLVSQRLVYASLDDVSLAPKGLAALDEYRSSLEQEARQKAEEKAQKAAEKEEDRAYAAEQNRKNRHHDYLVATFELLFGYLIGVITQVEFDVAGFFVNLLEKISSLFH